jgi:AhpD family alkylhydroperoxidase
MHEAARSRQKGQKGGVSHSAGLSRLTGMTTQQPRLEPLSPEKAPLMARLMYRYAKRRFGEVPTPFAVGAHHMPLLVANAVHEALLERGSKKLPAAIRELAVYWTARTVGCSWCVDFGTMLIRLEGLDTDRLRQVDSYATSPLFSDDERAAIAYADAMTTDPHQVTDAQVADLRQRFGDAGVMELTYQIGIENMRARMNTALGITEQGFSSGALCEIPARRIPWAPEPPDHSTAKP